MDGHYIADLMETARTAGHETRVAKQEKCSKAALELWKHRSQLPAGQRPLQEFDPILRTMESLDPDKEEGRYFGLLWREAAETEEGTETSKWLRFADSLDYSARILIRYCLARAAQGAADISREWVSLANEAEASAPASRHVTDVIESRSRISSFGKEKLRCSRITLNPEVDEFCFNL